MYQMSDSIVTTMVAPQAGSRRRCTRVRSPQRPGAELDSRMDDRNGGEEPEREYRQKCPHEAERTTRPLAWSARSPCWAPIA